MATRKPRRATPTRKTSARRRRPVPPAPRKTATRRTAPAPKREQRHQNPQTFRLRGIEPSFTVNDLQTSLGFYTDVLGFIVSERWTDGDVLRGVMLKAGACQLGLSQDDWKKGRDRKKGEGMRLWCETVQDIDALAERIKKAGGRLTEEPNEQSWGARALSVADPDGFHLTIYKER